MTIVPDSWDLPQRLRARISNSYGRQRAMLEDGHLLLVLHRAPGTSGLISCGPSPNGILFWRDQDGYWRASTGLEGADELRDVVSAYSEVESTHCEAFDGAKTLTDLFSILEEVTPLERAARNLHSALQSARDAISHDALLLEMRDLAYSAEHNLEMLATDLRHAIQFRTARDAEEQARLTSEALNASNRLNVLVALFLPTTAVAGIFGMNMVTGLEHIDGLFWITVVVSLLLGGAFTAWMMAKR